MQRIDSEYVSRENEKVLKKIADAFLNKANSTDGAPHNSTLFVDFYGDSGDFNFSDNSKKDFKTLYAGIMKKFDVQSKQSIFVAGQDDSKRRADFMMILNTLLSDTAFLKNLDKVIPVQKIYNFLAQFWITTDTEELQCHSSIQIDFEKKKDQDVLHGISFHFLFGNLVNFEKLKIIQEQLAKGVNNSYKIFEYIMTAEFDEVMDLFFQEDEKDLILDVFQSIMELEKVNNIKEVAINPSENFKSVQKYLHMTDEQFYEWVLCIRAVKLDSWKLNIQEFQNQLYYMIFEVILSKINRYFEKSSNKDEKNLKTLTVTNIWNLKLSNEISSSWNDFFVHYSLDFWKISIFDITKQEFYLEGIRHERLCSFIDLVDRDNHDVFSIYSTQENFVKENVITEALTNFYPFDSILKIKEEGFKIQYPFSMYSVHYNLPLVQQKKRYWKFVESTLKQNIKDSDYFFRFYNDLEDFQSLISGEHNYMLSYINASVNVKDQVNLLGIQYLKSINFNLVSPRRQPIRKLTKPNSSSSSSIPERKSLFVNDKKFQSPKSLFEKYLDSESDLFENYSQSIENAKNSFKQKTSPEKENEPANIVVQVKMESLHDVLNEATPKSHKVDFLTKQSVDSSSSLFADKENISSQKNLIEREVVSNILVERKDTKRGTPNFTKISKDVENPGSIAHMGSTCCSELGDRDSVEPVGIENLKFEISKSELFWLFEYISQIETYSFVIKQDFSLFSLNYTQKFLDLSKEFFLSEIKLTKLYLNIGSFSASKILNTNAITKIIAVFEQIFQFSVESWMYFVQIGIMDYMSILLQNYTQSLKFEENNLFLFQDDAKEKKKYMRSAEDHFVVINQILKFFDLITKKFSTEHCHKQMSIFHYWFENSGKIAISTMIDLCNQSCEGIKHNQGRDAYHTIFTNILKTLLNLGKSESLFLFLYDENLALILSHYFSELVGFPEIQILIMRLSARLCSKVLMINYFIKHGLILEIVKTIGTSTSPYFIKACVEVIASFSRQPQFTDEFIESFAHLMFYRLHEDDPANFPSESFNENLTVEQRIAVMRCLIIKMTSYILNLQSKGGKSNFEIQYFSNKHTTKFVNVFRKTLSQKIQFNEEILQSIQFLDVEDFNFDTKIKFIAELFKNLDAQEKERTKNRILKYMHTHGLPKVKTSIESKSVLEIDQYAMMI